VGKPEGRRMLERPGRQWVDNTKTGIEEIGRKGLDIVSCKYGNKPCLDKNVSNFVPS